MNIIKKESAFLCTDNKKHEKIHLTYFLPSTMRSSFIFLLSYKSKFTYPKRVSTIPPSKTY